MGEVPLRRVVNDLQAHQTLWSLEKHPKLLHLSMACVTIFHVLFEHIKPSLELSYLQMKHVEIFWGRKEGVLSRICRDNRTLAHGIFGLLEKLRPLYRAIFEMELSSEHHLVYLISLVYYILILLEVVIFFKWW